MQRTHIEPRFVELIPEFVEEGVLYVSEVHGTAIHKCCCGCGEEVVTPLSPADWQLVKHGNQVSLFPSIGNWNYQCQSHYWIRRNRVEWAAKMTRQQILRVQAHDRADKARWIAARNMERGVGFWWWLKGLWHRLWK